MYIYIGICISILVSGKVIFFIKIVLSSSFPFLSLKTFDSVTYLASAEDYESAYYFEIVSL